MRQIQVVKADDGTGYFLRLFVGNDRMGTVCFTTFERFSKREADSRAVLISMDLGTARDELPTHPEVEAWPSREDQ